MNLRWSWDERTRDLFRWVDPDALGRHASTTRSGSSASCRRRPARRAGRRPRLPALPRRDRRRARRATSTAPRWFQSRERPQPAAAGRLLLARVRHRRGAPAVLGRPRRAGRRPPEGGQRPRRAARRRRPLLPPRLLPPGAQPSTAGSRSASPTSTRTPWPSRRCDGVRVTVDLAGEPLHGPGLAGRRRPRRRSTCSTPTSTRTRPSCAPSPTGSTAATPSTASARRSCSASAACGPCEALGIDAQVFHTNEGHAGFLGLERIRRADGRRRPGASREALEAVRAGMRLHHPHAGAGRHRPLPPRAHGAVLRRLGRASAASPSTSSWPSATSPATSPTSPLQHGGHGPAPGRPVQRRVAAARRGQPGDVRRPVARRARRGGARSASVTNGVHAADVGRRPRWTTCCARYVLPDWDEAAGRRLGARRRRPRRRAVAGRASRAASASSASSASGCAQSALAQGVSASRRGVDRRGARPRGAHHRLRPPLRHLQAGHAAAVAARAAAGAAARRPTGRCSSCSPARPTRPTTPGKEMIREIVPVRRRPRRAPPLRVPRRLRHRRGPRAATRAPTCGSTPRAARTRRAARVGHEGRAQRRAQLLDPRRLVGRVVRRRRTAGPSRRPRPTTDLDRRDEIEANSLFDLLERQIVPLFYDRCEGPVPRRWVRAGEARRCARSGPKVTASRMVRDYVNELYEPAAPRRPTGSAPTSFARARALAAWKRAGRRGLARASHIDRRRRRHRLAELGTDRARRPRCRARRRWVPTTSRSSCCTARRAGRRARGRPRSRP